jgi:hypothetical protein
MGCCVYVSISADQERRYIEEKGSIDQCPYVSRLAGNDLSQATFLYAITPWEYWCLDAR